MQYETCLVGVQQQLVMLNTPQFAAQAGMMRPQFEAQKAQCDQCVQILEGQLQQLRAQKGMVQREIGALELRVRKDGCAVAEARAQKQLQDPEKMRAQIY